MGLFSKKSNAQDTSEQAAQQETNPAGEPLPAQGPLRNLINRLVSDGAQGGKLTLIQRGNTMNQQTERNVNGSVETDSGTVDQSHPLFDDVAGLYTESMSQESGAWQTVVITAGQDTVQVDYDYPSAPRKTQTYRLGEGADAAAQDGARGADSAAAREAAQPVEQRGAQDTAQGGSQQAPADSAQQAPSGSDQQDARASDQQSAPAQSQNSSSSAAAAGAAGVGGGALAAAAAQGRQEEAQQSQNPNRSNSAQAHGDTSQASQSAEVQEGAAAGGSTQPDPSGQSGRQAAAQGDLPDHVDHDEWRDDNAGRSGGQTTGAAAAGAGARSVGSDADAPSVAHGADVAPSYKAGEAAGQTGSPKDRLAEGNKVLTEADVLGRLAGAQKRLFGPEGSALDVSTVLIRVRTLGSYYDALTHVRQGGFWDQRGTFDLVPEEELKVQELKEDSYVEGEGAPLAIMFRFRPGIPPEVSFDYLDEEAFVRYEQRLPSQNYVEELRMYPRTGANIPQHVNDALQDWNY
ncbi:hypothetical protein [Kocuria sp.]|uniref:hypothetical protein n=1 Tax=Kocuria sp. TaxID=1871328 RepID=UPI0026DFF58F|nr:hypothetical protein [Kocuria sp.]MDO5617545.1 hypothetical protein [Kocuria sp.]